jgi:hypothetical protein
MSRKVDVSTLLKPVTSLEELQKYIELSETKVVLIDCHLDW